MLNVYISQARGLARADVGGIRRIPEAAIWIDLLEPTPEEEKAVEAELRIEVPTREEMKEIEASNRLYEEDGVLYMTATVATKLDTERPETSAVTFILAKGRLITNRYSDPKPFKQYVAYAEKHPAACLSAPVILAGLIEAIVERIADILERAGSDLDAVSTSIFAMNGKKKTSMSGDALRMFLERIGFNGELNSKARESLVSLGRLLMFLQQSPSVQLTQEQRTRFNSVSRDVASLSDHASFLGSKVSFLLEATLGLINIEQNDIIKIFSIVAVMLMPPTLVASIYGMNFHFMPELSWQLGYPFAFCLMVISGVVPYLLFKRRGWL
jgi:magnesium transporter